MKNAFRFLVLAAAMSMAAPLFAGGLWFQIGNPKAVSDPAARDAFATVRVFGIGGIIVTNPLFTGTAEGIVNHQRVSIPLTFTKLATEGLYAVGWEQPKQGSWALDIRLHEWGWPGSSFRAEGYNISADLFAVGEHGVKAQVKFIVPRPDGLSPGRLEFELRSLAGEQIAAR